MPWVGERSESVPGLAPRWAGLGATMIGGCCRVMPEEVRQIRERLLCREASC